MFFDRQERQELHTKAARSDARAENSNHVERLRASNNNIGVLLQRVQ